MVIPRGNLPSLFYVVVLRRTHMSGAFNNYGQEIRMSADEEPTEDQIEKEAEIEEKEEKGEDPDLEEDDDDEDDEDLDGEEDEDEAPPKDPTDKV